MSKGVEVEIDTRQIERLFAQFDENERKKVFRSTLRIAGGKLVRETRKRLANEIGAAVNHPNSWNGRKLSQGVWLMVYRNNRSVKVSITKDFRLRFFELGTDERYTKGRHKIGKRRIRRNSYRGKIKPMYFFKAAKMAKEKEIFSGIEMSLIKSIERINKKKYG